MVGRFSEENLSDQLRSEYLEIIKDIKKDVLRTHPESHFFNMLLIQKSMIRMLLIYAINHPSTPYIQGMNELIAPFFGVFAGGSFNMSYLQLVNNFAKIEPELTEDLLLQVEADTYYCFCSFLDPLKQNFVNEFEGVFTNLEQLQQGIKSMDQKLHQHFTDQQVDILNFAFRWNLCLLIRELPLHLGIKLIDYYLVEECYPNELCVYLSLAMVLRFSFEMKQKNREDLIQFLQNVPTFDWGEQDIQLLVSESFILKKLIKKN